MAKMAKPIFYYLVAYMWISWYRYKSVSVTNQKAHTICPRIVVTPFYEVSYFRKCFTTSRTYSYRLDLLQWYKTYRVHGGTSNNMEEPNKKSISNHVSKRMLFIIIQQNIISTYSTIKDYKYKCNLDRLWSMYVTYACYSNSLFDLCLLHLFSLKLDT